MDTSDGLSPPHGSISTLDGALAKPIRHDRGNHPRFDDSFRPVNAFFDLELQSSSCEKDHGLLVHDGEYFLAMAEVLDRS
jgi:hypothetical protein